MAVKLIFHGHATWTIESDGTRILIDPFFDDNPLADIKASEARADYIIVSHGHYDHIADLVPIARRTGAQVISNFEIVTWCQKQGIEKAHPMHIGGAHEFPFGKVKLTPAFHGSVLPDGTYGGNPCGILVETGGKRIYDAADTALFSDMRLIGERHPLDAALLPIGDNFTMGPDDAVYAAGLLGAKVVIPMHYNTFDVIRQNPEAFARRVEAETKSRAAVLKPGESLEL